MSALPWFRMYHEFATDPKVQMLSEADQRRFVMLLCIRCCNGDVTVNDDAAAFQFRISADEWAETKARLVARGLIDEANTPVNWAKRQQSSDSSKSRVYAHRERKKQERNGDVTAGKRPGNGTDLDIDSDLEEEEDKPVRPEQVAARAKADGAEEILGLNGSTAEIVNGIAKFLNVLAPDHDTARRIVASNVGLYGSDAVRDGYAELMADVADNKVRVPSVKALLGYFKTAGDRKARPRRDQSNRPQWAVERDAKIAAFTAALKTYQ